MTDLEKTLAAQEWIDRNSGEDTWRFVRLVDREFLSDSPRAIMASGFLYDGPGFYAPRFKSWDDNYAEYWLMLARKRSGKAVRA